jgi:hypothetical protein
MKDDIPEAARRSESTDRPNGQRLSALLAEIARDEQRERVSVGDLLDAFSNRAFGPLIFIFAVPNMLPVSAPGFTAVLGVPLLFLTFQLMVGRTHPWLPRLIAERSFAHADFRRIERRIAPGLQRIERMIRPRLLALTEPLGERLIGRLGLVLAIIIFLPIPLGNMLPAFALSLLSLGVLERDGLMILAATATGAIGMALVTSVVYGLAQAAILLVGNTFGV